MGKQEHKELNERQKTVVKLSADGKTAEEIATELGVTSRTVEYNLKDACDILKATNKVNLVAICLRKKIIV